MPLALAIIPAALAVAGTGLAIAGQQKSQRDLANARSAATAKAKGIQQQSNEVFQKSLAASSPQAAGDEMARGEQARTSAWNNLKSATTPIASALPATRTTVNNPAGAASTQTAGGVNAWNRLNAGAKARMGSYEDWQTGQAIKNQDASSKLSTLNNFQEGNSNLAGLELGLASQSGDQLSSWGSIVSTLGSMASAAKGNFAGGPKAAAGGAAATGSVANTPSVYAPIAGGNIPAWGGGGEAPNYSNIYRN